MWDVKYRPKKFAEVLGQQGSVTLLKTRLQRGTAFDTSYIFEGGHGQGKTTLARIFARAMLCLDLNKEDPEPCNACDNCKAILADQPCAFSERDAASQGTIENIRAIVDELPFSVFNAPMRVYLFDEAHRMGTGAQDVLLKPIEEKKMIGMFCTTEPEKIRGTIRSRCEPYTIRKVTREEILVRMKYVLQQEGVEHQDDAVLTIIDHSHGHVRDILNKMEMIAQLGPITLEAVREYLRLSIVTFYYEILLSLADPKKAIELVDQACDRANPEDVAAGLAEAAMNSYRLVNGMFADFVAADRDLGKKVYEKYGQGTILLAEHFLQGRRHASRISLLQAVLALWKTPGNLPVDNARSPIVFALTAGPSAATAPSAAVPPVTTVATAASASAPEAPTQAQAAPVNGSGKSPSPWQLPPLSELDPKLGLADSPMPRMSQHGPQHLVFPGKDNDVEERKPLQPDEFRREFEKTWPGRGDTGGG